MGQVLYPFPYIQEIEGQVLYIFGVSTSVGISGQSIECIFEFIKEK
jgi:hypothetical protein